MSESAIGLAHLPEIQPAVTQDDLMRPNMTLAITDRDAACGKCGWRNVSYCHADDCPLALGRQDDK